MKFENSREIKTVRIAEYFIVGLLSEGSRGCVAEKGIPPDSKIVGVRYDAVHAWVEFDFVSENWPTMTEKDFTPMFRREGTHEAGISSDS
jgi:hypothetical protein